MSRYDLVLASVPAALLFATLLGNALSLSRVETMATWAAIAAMAVVDGLFLSPPLE